MKRNAGGKPKREPTAFKIRQDGGLREAEGELRWRRPKISRDDPKAQKQLDSVLDAEYLRQLLDALNEKERHVFLRHELEGASFKEIAGELRVMGHRAGRERARQIHGQAIEKLLKAANEEEKDFEVPSPQTLRAAAERAKTVLHELAQDTQRAGEDLPERRRLVLRLKKAMEPQIQLIAEQFIDKGRLAGGENRRFLAAVLTGHAVATVLKNLPHYNLNEHSFQSHAGETSRQVFDKMAVERLKKIDARKKEAAKEIPAKPLTPSLMAFRKRVESEKDRTIPSDAQIEERARHWLEVRRHSKEKLEAVVEAGRQVVEDAVQSGEIRRQGRYAQGYLIAMLHQAFEQAVEDSNG
jgi:DNA-directed RNA polymerase specialized sigma24 family protein